MKRTLRPYQQEAVDAVLSNLKGGVKKQLMVMATGSGKTIVFSDIIDHLIKSTNKKALVLAHKKELLTQAQEKIQDQSPKLLVEIEQAEHHASEKADVIVASIQTVGREGSTRIGKWKPEDFCIVVTDECVVGETEIATEDGTQRIKDIVNAKYNGRVWVLVEGKLELKRVTDWFKNKPSHPLKKILFSQFQKSLVATSNHKIDIVDPRTLKFKETQVGKLKIGDLVATFPNTNLRTQLSLALSSQQQSLLFATLLGDGNITKNKNTLLARFKYSQTKSKHQWFNERVRFFSNLGVNKSTGPSGFKDEPDRILQFTTKSSYQISELKDQFNKSMAECLDVIDTQGLAWFFGDDGSCSVRQNKTKTITYTSRFNTQGFTFDQNKVIQCWLKEKFDITADILTENKRDGRSFFYLSLKTKEAYELSDMISAYLTEDMQYKLHPDHRGRYIAKEVETNDFALERVSSVLDAQNETVFNITVEHVHNYFANQIYVHNCHHAPADTYRSIFKWLGCLKKGKAFKGLDDEDMDLIAKHDISLPSDDNDYDWNKNILLLGVTATPNRMDNKGVNTIFDKQVYQFDIKAGVDCGALVRPKGRIIRTRTDITKVKQQQGDFKVGELSEAIDTPERNLLVVKAYLDNLKDIPFERVIVFAADVAHTKHLTEEFIKHGVSADYVIGETPSEARKQKLIDFKTGKISVMVNAMVLAEGYDNEYVGGIMIARPTRSGILYLQMIGRGTRPVFLDDGTPSPLKPHVLVLDFVDVTSRHDIKSISHILNIDQPIDFQGEDVFDLQDKINNLLELAPGTDLGNLDINRIDYAIQEVDLLAGLQPPRELTDNTRFDWFKIMDGFYKLNLGGEKGSPTIRSLYIEENQMGEWTVNDREFNKTTHQDNITETGSYPDFKEAIKEADKYIRTTYKDSLRLIDSHATWRFGAISPTQTDWLRRARVPEATIQRLNKGDAVRLLNKLWSQRR